MNIKQFNDWLSSDNKQSLIMGILNVTPDSTISLPVPAPLCLILTSFTKASAPSVAPLATIPLIEAAVSAKLCLTSSAEISPALLSAKSAAMLDNKSALLLGLPI